MIPTALELLLDNVMEYVENPISDWIPKERY
jgi:hypothetical protein